MTAPAAAFTYTQQRPEEMTYEEYLAAVAVVTAALAAIVLAISLPFQTIALTRVNWLAWLAATYPHVERARREVADLSRRFYDSERAEHVPRVELPLFDFFDEVIGPDGRPVAFEDSTELRAEFYERLNINLPPYEPDWYEEAMEAVVDLLTKPLTSDGELVDVVSQVLKEAENGGRRATIWAVQDDPRVFGWARVQGGEDSCGFCAMLISRGPVYKNPRQAGFNVSDQARAVELYRQGEATGEGIPEELMTRWHPNCDCKVVPVFSEMQWPGRDEFLRLEQLWQKITGPYASVGTRNGRRTTPKLNAFRRFLENGTIPPHLTADDLRDWLLAA